LIILWSWASWATSFNVWFYTNILILWKHLILINIVSKLCYYWCLRKFFHQISLFICHMIPLDRWMFSSIYRLRSNTCIQQIFFQPTYFLYLTLFDLLCSIQRNLVIPYLTLRNFAWYIYLIFSWIIEICVALSIYLSKYIRLSGLNWNSSLLGIHILIIILVVYLDHLFNGQLVVESYVNSRFILIKNVRTLSWF
jgi:hypothetical protein